MVLKTLGLRLGTQAQRLPTLNPGSWRTEKTSSTARGYGYAWQKARARHLQAHPLCVRCLETTGKPVAGTVVDHRIPHRGDQALFWDPDNWQTLCATHHSAEKQREEAREARGG